MRDPAVRLRRKALLELDHIRPLTRYAAELRRDGRGAVAEFDPLDGGVNAAVLFLFEKPGPGTSEEGGGSGFISRNNDDPTADATHRFMQSAGIPRGSTASWNVIPWWNGTRAITPPEIQAGERALEHLLGLFIALKVIVLVGRKAEHVWKRAAPKWRGPIITSAHPSPLVRARYPGKWNAIGEAWSRAREYC